MEDIRWQQRFENFEKSQLKLQKALHAHQAEPANDLIQMALIQAFEMTYELGWKTMKDYLKYQGIAVQLPRDVIKEAFANGLIQDGQAWINMLEDRNLMAHTYSEEKALLAIQHIVEQYAPAIEQVYKWFSKQKNTQIN